jgi:hypothetical protein
VFTRKGSNDGDRKRGNSKQPPLSEIPLRITEYGWNQLLPEREPNGRDERDRRTGRTARDVDRHRAAGTHRADQESAREVGGGHTPRAEPEQPWSLYGWEFSAWGAAHSRQRLIQSIHHA